MNILPTIGNNVGHFLQNLISSHDTYIAPPLPKQNPLPGTSNFAAAIAPINPQNPMSPRPVPTAWQPAIAAAYQAHPSIPKGMLESVLMKESSMGTNPDGFNPKNGQSAWIGGITNIAKTALAQKGITADTDSQAGAIQTVGNYLAQRQKGTYNNGKSYDYSSDPTGWYFNQYKTNATPTSPQDKQNFQSYMNYYGNNPIASSGRTLQNQ